MALEQGRRDVGVPADSPADSSEAHTEGKMKRMKVLIGKRRMMVLLTLTVLVLAAAALVASSASFTASSANPGNMFTAGTLTMSNSKANTAVVTAAQMMPGQTTSGGVTVTNTGDVSGDFSADCGEVDCRRPDRAQGLRRRAPPDHHGWSRLHLERHRRPGRGCQPDSPRVRRRRSRRRTTPSALRSPTPARVPTTASWAVASRPTSPGMPSTLLLRDSDLNRTPGGRGRAGGPAPPPWLLPRERDRRSAT